jgi:hypothetical protein
LGGNYVKLPIFDSTLLSNINFEEKNNLDILLYPNPSSDGTINLQFPELVKAHLQFTVYSINGNLIENSIAHVEENKVNLNYSNLASGTYILSIDWNSQKIYKKFIIR